MKEWLPVVSVLCIPFAISYGAVAFLPSPFWFLAIGAALTLMFVLAITAGQVMERYNHNQRELETNNDTNRIPPPDDYITSLNRAFYGGNRESEER